LKAWRRRKVVVLVVAAVVVVVAAVVPTVPAARSVAWTCAHAQRTVAPARPSTEV
jgi:hypothetical protein